jgi:hypothetical protein
VTIHEIDQLWTELREIRMRIDRLWVAVLIVGGACGGSQLVSQILGGV